MHTKLPIISFLQKLIIFCCLIFKEFEKKFLNQEIYGQLSEQAWSKGSFDFLKIIPLGAPRLFIQMLPKWKEVFIRMDSLLTMITNSFKSPVIQKLENIFYFFIFIFCTKAYSLFKNISKIKMTKISGTQIHLFHANADIKRMFTSFKSAFKNGSIHEQKQKDQPPISPLS